MRKIKKDDLVQIITGKDRGKSGKVLSVDSKKNTVIVEGCNMHTKHAKHYLAMIKVKQAKFYQLMLKIIK